MTAEEAKGFEHANIILQALGVQERVEVVMSQVDLRRGDVVLVSSDGLHGPVTDEEILQILQEEPDLKKACDRLVARALEREGPDNITVVVARFDGPGLPDPKPGGAGRVRPLRSGLRPQRSAAGAQRPGREGHGRGDRPQGGHPPDRRRRRGRRGRRRGGPGRARRGSRSETSAVLSFLLITLLAATAAGGFVKCDRSRALESERQAAAAAMRPPNRRPAPASSRPATPAPSTPSARGHRLPAPGP